MTLHIHAPEAYEIRITGDTCPNCKGEEMLMESYEWYGPTFTCLCCGDQYNEEGRAPRPFARGWRARAVELARRSVLRFVPTFDYQDESEGA